MQELVRRSIGGRVAVATVTECCDGDMHPDRIDASTLQRRQVELTGALWVMLDEVHGTEVFAVDFGAATQGPFAGTGDVLVADQSSQMLAVWAADCAPIALFGTNGTTRVVAHGGWRGLADGVIDVAVDALESTGTTVALAVLGPCIHACCNEFGAGDLERVAVGVGAPTSVISATTLWGTPALDVPVAVGAGLARRGVELDVVGACTGCDQRFWSHRRRGDLERHAMVVWFEEAS